MLLVIEEHGDHSMEAKMAVFIENLNYVGVVDCGLQYHLDLSIKNDYDGVKKVFGVQNDLSLVELLELELEQDLRDDCILSG